MIRKSVDRMESKRDFGCKISRRKALTTAGKIAVTAVIAGAVAGVGGYLAGTSAAPARTIEKTVTRTVTETAMATTVTKTVTTSVPAVKPLKVGYIYVGQLETLDGPMLMIGVGSGLMRGSRMSRAHISNPFQRLSA